MINEVIFAGSGGQGIMLIGKILAMAGMFDNKNVTWFPSYGAEMRGGMANCSVIISDKVIGSPIISNASSAIIMNQPSLNRYVSRIKPGGFLLINSSLAEWKNQRKDIDIMLVPVTDLADKTGGIKVANMIALSAFCVKTAIVSWESLNRAVDLSFATKHKDLININRKALRIGKEQVMVNK